MTEMMIILGLFSGFFPNNPIFPDFFRYVRAYENVVDVQFIVGNSYRTRATYETTPAGAVWMSYCSMTDGTLYSRHKEILTQAEEKEATDPQSLQFARLKARPRNGILWTVTMHIKKPTKHTS